MSATRLAELIRENQPCVVLTGAGVSTESGIPDFRSPSGLWAEYNPMEYATIQAFHRDPVKVWDFYARRFEMLVTARPNSAHEALAELERDGYVEAVVTQNIDRLHELAGSRNVVEVHGSIRTSRVSGRRPPASHPGSRRHARDREPRADAVRRRGRPHHPRGGRGDARRRASRVRLTARGGIVSPWHALERHRTRTSSPDLQTPA